MTNATAPRHATPTAAPAPARYVDPPTVRIPAVTLPAPTPAAAPTTGATAGRVVLITLAVLAVVAVVVGWLTLGITAYSHPGTSAAPAASQTRETSDEVFDGLLRTSDMGQYAGMSSLHSAARTVCTAFDGGMSYATATRIAYTDGPFVTPAQAQTFVGAAVVAYCPPAA